MHPLTYYDNHPDPHKRWSQYALCTQYEADPHYWCKSICLSVL